MNQTRHTMDMLEGSLWDKIIRFALPLAATGILQQLFNAADIAVVGRFTGAKGALAMAAVGANAPVIGLIISLFVGVSLGTNVIIANSVGRRDETSIGKAVHTSLLFAAAAGSVIAAAGQLIAAPLMRTQGVPEEVMPLAVLYFRIYMAGAPVILLYNFASAIFRGVGRTKLPLIALTVSGAVNVALNLLFVAGFHMTVEGVALATVLANAVSASILLVFLAKADGAYRLRADRLRISGDILLRILRIGVPAGLQSAVFAFANIIIQTAINSLGTSVMAASGAAYNVEVFAYYMLNGFSQACTTFVGQNYGAGRIDRCRRAMGLCWLEGLAALGISVGLILLFGRRILSVFNGDPEVIAIGYVRLVVICSAYVFTLSYEVLSGYMRGFGISVTPAVITMLCICGTRISWIYGVFPRVPTFACIMTVYPVSLSATALCMLLAVLAIRPAAHVKARSEQARKALARR